MNELYDTEFEELFDSKRQAIVCFLSLERRYLKLCQYLRYKKKLEEEDDFMKRKRITRKYSKIQKRNN